MTVPDLPDRDGLLLDGMMFNPEGGVIGIQNLNSFQRKQVTNDYTRDSNPILSTWVITDESGGHGVISLEEGADAARYRFGVIDARKPRQITLPPYVRKVPGPGGIVRPLGALKGTVFIACGNDIYSWDETTKTLSDTTANLASAPVNLPVRFKGKLYVPLGDTHGYDTFDGVTTVTHGAIDFVAFCYWDTRFIGIDADGQSYTTIDGLSWDNLSTDGLLDDAYTPKNIHAFRDSQSQPVPMIVTDQGLFALDPSGPGLYRSDVQYPRHPDFGDGSTVFQGEMFLSVGMGVFRFNGSTQVPIGLDRDQGLPAFIRGSIVSLLGDYNGMWALVSSTAQAGDDTETFEMDSTDEDWYVGQSQVVSSLHIWTTYGWHCYWTSGDDTGTPTYLMTSTEDDAYRLWWGVGTNLYTMQQSFDFANARQLIESGTGWFAESGYFDTGEFDASMVSYTKIANSLLIRVRNASPTSQIQVSYRVPDDDNMWHLLGTVQADGQTVFPMGEQDAYGTHKGVPFLAIEFRFSLSRASGEEHVSEAPIIDSIAFSHLKVLPPFHSFTCKLNLAAEFNGVSPEEMAGKLEELQASNRFFTMIYRRQKYKVRIAGGGGNDFAGKNDDRGSRTINLIEIPDNL